MAWEYSDKTKQLFADAMTGKAGTHLGIIENADGEGLEGSIVCGDAMKITFKVEKNNDPTKDIICDIRYQTFGCTSAIASSEALCQLVVAKKMTPIEAAKISNKDIVNFLGGLPEQKIHCSVMGAQAMEKAILNWAEKRGVDPKSIQFQFDEHHEEDEGKVVCTCFSITENFIIRKAKELDLRTVDQIRNATKAGGACHSCIERPGGIRDILRTLWGTSSLDTEKVEGPVTPHCFQDQIEKVIVEKVRPSLQAHGGDISVLKIKGEKVYCELLGACGGCPGAAQTLKNIVEKQLQELVHPTIKVINI